MAIQDCARAAVRYFTREEAIIIVAIGGPESGYRVDAEGDAWFAFPLDQQPEYRRWSCRNATAFGWLQVNLRWNHEHVQRLSGATAPCDMAAWLENYDNSAHAGRVVWDNQGPGAWSAYNTGDYRNWLADANDAVDVALGFAPSPGLVHPVEPPSAAVEPPLVAVEPPSAPIRLE